MEFYLIGYSGHAFVTIESAIKAGHKILGYFEIEEKKQNPFQLKFMGNEDSINSTTKYNGQLFFVGIGNNNLRAGIFAKLKHNRFSSVIDPSANISTNARFGDGVYIGKNVCINALSNIGTGAIINTGAIVEHESEIGAFTHIAPGAVICGNVKIGFNSFIGANSVIKQGTTIGNNVTIGAGSVVIKNVENDTLAFGNPLRLIK